MIRWPLVAVIVIGVVHATTITAIAVGIPQGLAPTPARAGDPCGRAATAERRAACAESLLSSSYSPMDMGVPDFGLPRRPGGHLHAGRISLDSLVAPPAEPQQRITLTAATDRRVIGGIDQTVLTFNGTTPGPTLTFRQGELVEVTLRNADVAQGVTIHWHGVDVPGAEDGVAGVTQDAVLPGDQFVYRFVVPDAGTYWYHTHQDSVRSVAKGLLGAIVVQPSTPDSTLGDPPPTDLVALVHTYGPVTTINGRPGSVDVGLAPGSLARVRFVNGDNGPRLVTASVPFRVAAIDGTDVSGGTELTSTYVELPAGGRADLLILVDTAPVRAGVLGGPSLVLGSSGAAPPPALAATRRFDALSYGTPGGSQQALEALGPVTRSFGYRVGRRVGYLDGRRGEWYTINGRTIPDVPMFMVERGDVVRFRVSNSTPLVHPMHLHGHHALVVSRNGVPATGAAWWVDSLEVAPRESYELVLVADNPGVWMFHCHNLPHARAGLMTHLMYADVRTPYRIGRVSPGLVNQPE